MPRLIKELKKQHNIISRLAEVAECSECRSLLNEVRDFVFVYFIDLYILKLISFALLEI